jgi:type II secretory pathway component GspD/PulD (secretin)
MKCGRNNKNNVPFMVIGVLALVGMIIPAAYAAEEPAAAATAEVEAVQEQAPVSAQPLSPQSLQTISFKKDMPIKDALRMLAQMYQKNIVPSAKVDGIVTVTNLYDVTFEEALQSILGSHKYEIKGNFVRVYTNEEFKNDKTRQEKLIIPLFYISAEEAEKLSKPLLSDVGAIGVTSAKNETEPGQGGNTPAIRDYLVVSDYPEVVKNIKEVLKEVDIAPPQVLIEVTVLEASLTESTKFGVDFDLLNRLDAVTSAPAITSASLDTIGETGIATKSGTLSVGIVNNNIRAFITALETITDVTTLANPKILALNKQAGKIIIGRQDGYKSSETISSSGGTSTQEVKMLESGTVLQFRPFVGKDGLIRMELHPEQSNGAVNTSTGLPEKSTTEVLTNIMVKDGKTIVLGGLFKEKTSLGRSQVPLLGDIPLLGELFKSTNDSSERVELIVLLTPHIVNEPEEADGATRLEDVRRLAYNARQNLTWMSRAKLDEQRYAKAVALYDNGNLDGALAELETQEVWGIDRNYLDPLRLKEKIIREKQPDKINQMERIMLGNLEKEESGKWLRR